MNIVCEAKGIYVPWLAERSDCRYLKGPKQKEGRGGPRKKGVHSLAREKRKAGMHEDLKAMRAVEMKMREDGSIQSGEKFISEIVQFKDDLNDK